MPRRVPTSRFPTRLLVAVLALAGSLTMQQTGLGQPPAPRAGNAFTVLTAGDRQALATTVVNGQDVAPLDELARIFQLTVREDTLAGGLTISARGKTLVLSTTQGLASAGGRLISLSGPPVKQGRSWFLPLDAINRALPLLLDTPIEVRHPSRLVLVGDVRVPRVVVRTEGQAPLARVIIDITPATPHVVEQEARRLLVRFEAQALDTTLPAVTAGDLLNGIRLSDTGPALALELGPAFASFRASDEPAARGGGTRLTIELRASGAAESTPTPTPASPPVQPDAPPLFEPPTTALRTVVLDPGHGGEETGAKGAAGILEKDVALAVARQLRAMLESRLGVRVLLTRDGDQTVPLDARAALANNNKADVFVSLHANASARSSTRGAEVFYLSAGEYNAEAREQAALEGDTLALFSGGERRVEMVLWEMAQLQHLQDSAALATIIERRLRDRIPMNAMAIQQAPFRVLVGANMPAVLVELGFITNGDEETQLGSPSHQAVLAQAIYDSLVEFRGYLEGGRRPRTAEEPRPGDTPRPPARSGGATPPGAR